MSQVVAKRYDLVAISGELPRLQGIGGAAMYCYGAYQMTYCLTNHWGRSQEHQSMFYGTDLQGVDLVLGRPVLAQAKIQVDCAAKQWRFGIDKEQWSLDTAKQFQKNLQGESLVYAVVCAAMAPLTTAKRQNADGAPPSIPTEFQDYGDVFSIENAGRLPMPKPGDHAIELQEGEPPYGPLYNLSAIELKELRQYLDDALEKGW
ncbi:MAG: hypothetical protein ACRDZY_16895, partial [Acidimicrobiales bacterium]